MNRAPVDLIARAVLYEGYILYPYRPSLKNRQRWTFGGLYPEGHCGVRAGTESCEQRTECLVIGTPRTRVEVVVRFLHLRARRLGAIEPPLDAWSSSDEPPSRPVESLQVDGRSFHAWQEAQEREIVCRPLTLGALSPGPSCKSSSSPAAGAGSRCEHPRRARSRAS